MKNKIEFNMRKHMNTSRLHLILYFVITLTILWHLLLPGYVFALDMVFAPNIKINDLFYGLGDPTVYGGRLPFCLISKWTSLVIPVWFIQKILMFLILFLAGFSAHKLCPTSNMFGKFFAGLIYMLNPFVYVRFMVGHWVILLAYAVTPLSVKTMMNFLEEQKLSDLVKLVLMLTLIGIFSSHMLLINLFVFLIFLVTKLIRRGHLLKLLKNVGLLFCLLFLLNIYWILPSVTEQSLLTQITYKDLLIFTSRSWGTGFNILFNLASMHGFWRLPEGYTYISNLLPCWYLIYVFILFLTIYGFLATYSDKQVGSYVKALGAVSVISLILASGISTPYFSGFFEFIFNNVPFFKGFREPQKFVALLVLAYAYLGGLGVNELHKKLKDARRKNLDKERIAIILLIGFALISSAFYSVNMFFGFNGQLKTVNYPEEWYEVNMFLNSQEGNFNVLFFPWHGYMKFSWTDRIIMNPARGFFDRPVIQGENIEVGPIETHSPKPTQHYIRFLLNHRDKIKNFGELVALLNVKYINLAKEVDYKEYGFLYNQRDLKVVLDNRKMIIFESQCKTAKIYWVKDLTHINSWKDILKEPLPEPVPLNYVQLSPVEYEVEVPFNGGYIVLTEPYDEGWRLNGEKPAPNLGLTNAFYVEKPGTYKIYFQKFNILLTYYLISLATFIACITLYTRSYLKSKYGYGIGGQK